MSKNNQVTSPTPQIIVLTVLWTILFTAVLYLCVRHLLHILLGRLRLHWALSAIRSDAIVGADSEDELPGSHVTAATSVTGRMRARTSSERNRVGNVINGNGRHENGGAQNGLWEKGLALKQILVCAAVSTYRGHFINRSSPRHSTPSSASDDLASDDDDTQVPICAVCLDDIRPRQNVCFLSCGHIFHAKYVLSPPLVCSLFLSNRPIFSIFPARCYVHLSSNPLVNAHFLHTCSPFFFLLFF